MARPHFRLRDQFMPPGPERHFRWRGGEVTRLEGFADAVFAFAVTLLIVALEVPRTFEGLLDVVHSFPAFVAAFALLMVFWNLHYRFFRRYGLQDRFTRFVNIAILLMVLFSVYPLKFLFSAWLGGNSSHRAVISSYEQLQQLYLIYGLGLASIWALYAVLHWHALRLRHRLQLNPVEVILTRGTLVELLVCILVCWISIFLAYQPVHYGIPGFAYALLGPLLAFSGWWHGRQVKQVQTHDPQANQTAGARDHRR